jgi:hypothetical protein
MVRIAKSLLLLCDQAFQYPLRDHGVALGRADTLELDEEEGALTKVALPLQLLELGRAPEAGCWSIPRRFAAFFSCSLDLRCESLRRMASLVDLLVICVPQWNGRTV